MVDLYGAVMSPLPTREFEWVCVDQFYNLNIINLPDDAEIINILEVDIEYLLELHELPKDIPMCPQKKVPPGGKH